MSYTDVSERIRSLVDSLNKAARAYYAEDREIMSNYEYDKLYDELVRLEEESGIVLSDSPTVNVGYESVDELPKERHESPMLSLGKTKSREELQSWLNGHPGLLSWKLDGLTVVLTYRNGELFKAVTRGNGEVGEVITNNARTFKNIPLKIAYQGELILRGEAVISYSDFEKINAKIPQLDAKYKNPRNLCSGSVRQLNNEITAERNVQLYAFSLVKAEGVEFHDHRSEQYAFLRSQGFTVVEEKPVTQENILDTIAWYEREIETYDIPSDGLVLTYEEIAYAESLGRTAKFPRGSIAFKWADEIAETTLREIEWSPSRTGLINPVAVFDPVELEGTTVTRASVHNISVMRALHLGIGDRITVYKANMIIPQIAENLTKSDALEIPAQCPVCGGKTKIDRQNDAESLICTNEACPAKKIKLFTHFVTRDAMNIDGLSEMTLEKFIGAGLITEFADIFHLDAHREVIVSMEGFGEKSYDNLIRGIDDARVTTLPRLLNALGIPNVGLVGARLLSMHFHGDPDALLSASAEELSQIEGVGAVIAGSFVDYFADAQNRRAFDALCRELTLEKAQESTAEADLKGMSFVVTGSLNHFANRDALKEAILARGGKVTGSVTGKTVCLINNDATSNSTKNQTAKKLGVAILTEEEFMAQYHVE
ncbi:MAG: NAD-dependent DNA ligase LigA [Lachnospiraceae bacterium]|nr:NAD-dependent DNA ligase LigA [Lachnospiraceae bacterium]